MSARKRAVLRILRHIDHEWRSRCGRCIDDRRRHAIRRELLRRVGSGVYDLLNCGDLFAVRKAFEESELSFDKLHKLIALRVFQLVEQLFYPNVSRAVTSAGGITYGSHNCRTDPELGIEKDFHPCR